MHCSKGANNDTQVAFDDVVQCDKVVFATVHSCMSDVSWCHIAWLHEGCVFPFMLGDLPCVCMPTINWFL